MRAEMHRVVAAPDGKSHASCGIAWSAFRFLSAAIQYAEAFPADTRTVPALWAFVAKLNRVLAATPLLDQWAVREAPRA